MNRIVVSTLAAALVSGLVSFTRAADKEVTLEGDLVCGSCALKESEKCENVLVVKDGDKKINYHLVPNSVSKKYDARTCGGDKIPVTVTGTLAEKQDKKMLTAKSISEG